MISPQSMCGAAERFGIGGETAIVWARRARQTGEREARKQGQPRKGVGNYPQSALGSRTPVQAMKDWHKSKPDLFVKKPSNRPELDKKPSMFLPKGITSLSGGVLRNPAEVSKTPGSRRIPHIPAPPRRESLSPASLPPPGYCFKTEKSLRERQKTRLFPKGLRTPAEPLRLPQSTKFSLGRPRVSFQANLPRFCSAGKCRLFSAS